MLRVYSFLCDWASTCDVSGGTHNPCPFRFWNHFWWLEWLLYLCFSVKYLPLRLKYFFSSSLESSLTLTAWKFYKQWDSVNTKAVIQSLGRWAWMYRSGDLQCSRCTWGEMSGACVHQGSGTLMLNMRIKWDNVPEECLTLRWAPSVLPVPQIPAHPGSTLSIIEAAIMCPLILLFSQGKHVGLSSFQSLPKWVSVLPRHLCIVLRLTIFLSISILAPGTELSTQGEVTAAESGLSILSEQDFSNKADRNHSLGSLSVLLIYIKPQSPPTHFTIHWSGTRPSVCWEDNYVISFP